MNPCYNWFAKQCTYDFKKLLYLASTFCFFLVEIQEFETLCLVSFIVLCFCIVLIQIQIIVTKFFTNMYQKPWVWDIIGEGNLWRGIFLSVAHCIENYTWVLDRIMYPFSRSEPRVEQARLPTRNFPPQSSPFPIRERGDFAVLRRP